MNIEQLPPPPPSNYLVGRRNNRIALIVEHWMAGSFDAALGRFMNPAAQVSAHYLVGTDGRVAQLVQDDDTAYHAGDFGVNLESIGIEHEAGQDLDPSEALYSASAQLHAVLALRHGLALQVGVTVKRHSDIVPTRCPGTLDVSRLIGVEMTDDEFKAFFDRVIGPSLEAEIQQRKQEAIDAAVAKVAQKLSA